MCAAMNTTRRSVMRWAAAAAALPSFAYAAPKKKPAKWKVGVTDWNLRLEGKVDAVALAKKCGFDGVQVSIGKGTDKLPLSDPEKQKAYLEASKRERLPISSLCLEILHKNGLKSDPLGQRWVADAIPIAKAMGVKVILLPFFGKWKLETKDEMDRVGDVLREVAPAAEKSGVILGLEDTISAEDNVRIMDRSKSKAVLTYYDVGNSTNNGFDVVKEIRWLGKPRICEVHLKDNPAFLGEGKIDFPAVVDALADIGFAEWAELETDCPTKNVEADMTRNLGYVRKLMSARSA
jgi:sugar phosphate isomerase/epimerase